MLSHLLLTATITRKGETEQFGLKIVKLKIFDSKAFEVFANNTAMTLRDGSDTTL